MKSSKQTLRINRPAKDVFAYVIDPSNTPKWIDWMTKEETNEWPVKLGTIYKNQNEAGELGVYEMTAFEPNKMFVMSKRGSSYHVKYTIRSIDDSTSELEYYEWVDEGELDEPFSLVTLRKLKKIMEAK